MGGGLAASGDASTDLGWVTFGLHLFGLTCPMQAGRGLVLNFLLRLSCLCSSCELPHVSEMTPYSHTERNSILGRLPLYVCTKASTLAGSRHMGFKSPSVPSQATVLT